MSKGLFEIPNNWYWAILSDIGSIAAGGTPSTKDETNFNGGISWLTPADLSGYRRKHISHGNRNLSEQGLKNSSAVLLPKGSVLFSSRAPIGYVVIAENPISTNQGFKNITVYEPIFNEYVYYYLKANKRLAEKNASGTTFLEISARNFSNLPIPIPPLPEQHRIVVKIEELFTKLDAGVDALKQVQAQLKRYRQAVLKAAVEGRLTAEWREQHKDELEPADKLLERIQEDWKSKQGKKYKELEQVDTSDLHKLPEKWTWANVKQIGDVITGTTPSKSKPEFYGGEFPFYKPTDLNAGYFVKESTDSLTIEGISNARLLPEDTILVTCIGATIGKTGLIKKPGASNQQINAIIPERYINPKFIYFLCISPFFQNQILSKASSTTLPILNKSKFEKLVLMMPPYKEQEIIVSKIERLFSIINESELVLKSELKRAQSLRHSILKRAFEGKLVPQDPNDEPASFLLERIEAEKAKPKKSKQMEMF